MFSPGTNRVPGRYHTLIVARPQGRGLGPRVEISGGTRIHHARPSGRARIGDAQGSAFWIYGDILGVQANAT